VAALRVTSDAHESSILAEALGLASLFLPRSRLALLEPYSTLLAYSPHSFSVLALFLTPLDATRGYSRVGRTARRPSTRLVLDSPTRVHHCVSPCAGRKGGVRSRKEYGLWSHKNCTPLKQCSDIDRLHDDLRKARKLAQKG
jgi:hypothetical protein